MQDTRYRMQDARYRMQDSEKDERPTSNVQR